MLRSALLCLACLLYSGSSLAQSAPAPPPAATPPAAATAAKPSVTGAPSANGSSTQASARQVPPAPGASPGPGAGDDATRRVRLRVTVDVIDPSRDVRDIISELRSRRADNPHPQLAPAAKDGSRERGPAAVRELRGARRELRTERREQRLERLENRQNEKSPQPGSRGQRQQQIRRTDR